MKRIFIDTNVLLDVLMQREHYQTSFGILALSETKVKRGFVSQGSLYTIAYLLRKEANARKIILNLLRITEVASCNTTESISGLQHINFDDIEDLFQHQTALAVKADAIITRDQKHFKHSAIPVFSPEEFLAIEQ